MKRLSILQGSILAVAAAGMLAAGPAFADRPSWAGGRNDQEYDHGHGHGHEKEQHSRYERRFNDHGRTAVREYFAQHYRSGRCPPGLERKREGCVSPRRSRRWAVGRTLPSGVAVYALPARLVTQIGAPPMGYRYVRVANDILMVAAGTNLVVDAINDLGR